MSDPVIDSRAAQTVPPPADAGSPPRADASPSTDASVPDASAADASASTDPSTAPTTPPRDAGSSSTTRSPTTSWSLELDGFVGGARLGGPHGAIFSPDFSPANEGWNFSRFSVGMGATHRWLLDPHFRVGLGGRAGYFGFSGDNHAPGRLDGGELSLHGEVGFPIIPEIEPVLRAMVTGILATGETTAGNNFSVDGTGGLGIALRAFLGIAIHLGQFTATPYFTAETGFIPNARGTSNAPWVDFGGGIMASYALGASSSNPSICSEGGVEETPGSISRRIGRLHNTEIPTLRGENDYHRDILRVLREGLGHRAESPEVVASIRHGYEYYLEHRSENPVRDAAVRSRLAREEFPDDFNPFNPTAVPETEVPDPLPTDCAELATLREALEIERDALDRQNGLLEGMMFGLLHEMGVPPQSAPSVMRAITLLEFPSSNFNQGKPDTAQLSTAQTYLSTFASQPRPTNAAEVTARAQQIAGNRTVRGIFPIASAEMQNLARVANILLGYELPSTVQPRSGSSTMSSADQEAVRDILSHMPVTIEAHASAEGNDDNNMTLTQRRADFIRSVLVSLGVPEERLTAHGYGETQLLVAETDDHGHALRGQQLTSARNRNRRVVFRPDVARMDPVTGHMRAAPTPPATAGGDGGTTPVVPQGDETRGADHRDR